jgi:4'-phosphopantetheinyl transferase
MNERADAAAILWSLNGGNVPEAHDALLFNLLSSCEKKRYLRFLRRERQRQFLLGRILLRQAISCATGLSLDRIAVIDKPGEAPEVIVPHVNTRKLSFSISHSQQRIICGVGTDCRLGVDVEFNDPRRDILNMSKMVFGSEDLRWLTKHKGRDVVAAFYLLWCSREAVLKLLPETSRHALALSKGGIGWHLYPFQRDGFTNVVCSNRRLSSLKHIELNKLPMVLTRER